MFCTENEANEHVFRYSGMERWKSNEERLKKFSRWELGCLYVNPVLVQYSSLSPVSLRGKKTYCSSFQVQVIFRSIPFEEQHLSVAWRQGYLYMFRLSTSVMSGLGQSVLSFNLDQRGLFMTDMIINRNFLVLLRCVTQYDHPVGISRD